MPVIVKDYLPAVEVLEKEGLFVITPTRSKKQDIRPLKIALVNLMPTKSDTEIQFLRLLSNTPLQLEITLVHMESHLSKNTSQEYLKEFYKTVTEIKDEKFDGMIITGAPVENLNFSDVDYWNELVELMEYTKSNVFSTLHVCWGAQAALFYHYGISKSKLEEKCFGVFPHKINPYNNLLLKGANDVIYMPHSRHSIWNQEEIEKNNKLSVLLKSLKSGIAMVSSYDARQIFISGHFEYDADTLSKEYFRDLNKGLPINIPENYFPNDNVLEKPSVLWRADANLLFSNWLNYVVYQKTPFDLNDLQVLF
ncbi:MAG: homoserine O-succinyltransferase [Alphaproteobacteria bacterium]